MREKPLKEEPQRELLGAELPHKPSHIFKCSDKDLTNRAISKRLVLLAIFSPL